MKFKRELPTTDLALPVLLVVLLDLLVNVNSTLVKNTSPTTSEATQRNFGPFKTNQSIETSSISINRVAVPTAKRQARARSLSEDSEDHRQLGDGEEPDQRVPVTKEGVQQMRRAARNAQRKMELVSGRLDQIQSLIAEDHKPSNYSEGNYSQTGSGSESANYETVSSTPNGGLINNNIESPNRDQWTGSSATPASSPEEADPMTSEQHTLSTRLSQLNPNNRTASNELLEWSTPIMNQIKSVIPTRQEQQDNRRDSEDSNNSDQSDSLTDVSGENFPSKTVKRPDSDHELKSSGPQELQQAQFSAYTGSRANITANEPTGSSMLGVEYNPNQNYQYFSDLNAENHRQAANKHSQEMVSGSTHNNNGAVAFRSFNPQVGLSKHKSQNMTAINTESDLMNSFSNQHQHRLPNNQPGTTTSTTRMPARKSAVHSYSSSNYGKSSKEQAKVAASAAPVLAAASETYETNEYPSNDNNGHFRDDHPIQWPTLAASYHSTKQQQSIPITIDDGIQNYDEKNRQSKSSDNAPRHSLVQTGPMMTQESGQMETIHPKISVSDVDGSNSGSDPNLGLYSSQSGQQQQVGSVSRQLNLQEADNSQNLYVNNLPSGTTTTTSDEMVQESNSEPIPERQKFMQDSNNPNELTNSRQQQLSRMAAAIVANNPSFSNLDINSLVQNYQQQQRILAAQLAQQQQQQQQFNLRQQQQQILNSSPIDRSSQNSFYRPSISRAFYTTSSDQKEAQNLHSVSKRYSPDVYGGYQIRPSFGHQFPYQTVADNSLVGTTGSDTAQVSNSDISSYGTANSQYQPYYSSYDSNKALAAYYRAMQAAAAASANSRASYDNSQYQNSALVSSGPNNYSTGSGSLYATAAMNSPIVYDPPKQQTGSDSYNLLQSGNIDSNAVSSSQSGQQSYPTGSYKRSYLNSLFKPSASSRYYYTPTILSPISLTSPTSAMHSLYAPAIATTAPDTMASLYAAANPYGAFLAPAAQHDQAAQYHALAAAANSLQPQYMEPDMAESSLVSSESQSPSAPSNDNDSGSSSSSKSGGKGLGPWTNIAGLLLGILPFGILMASLLPAVTVAGRRKRELELVGGRNFSELLSWRAPSKVLDVLMKSQRSDGISLSNASAIINEQLASLASGLKHNRRDRFNRRRSLTAGNGFLRSISANQSSSDVAMRDRSNPSSLIYSMLPDSFNLTTQQADGSIQAGNGSVQANGTLSHVKTKVKKAISALSHFITAAQNIKRKHRSSIIDTQWNFPAMLKNLLKLDNLFNVEEFKRQLASVAHTRAVLAQQRQLLEANVSNLATKLKPEVNIVPQRGPNEDMVSQSTTSRPVVMMNVRQNNDSANTHATPAQLASPAPFEKDLEESNINQTLNATVSTEYVATNIPAYDNPEESVRENPTASVKEPIDDTTRKHLEVCLNQFLCRLTVKLNKSLGSSMAGDKASKTTKNFPTNSEQLERITKSYINQLVEQIEAQNPAVLVGLREPAVGKTTSGLDALYKNAMKNQCPTMYNCVELDQLEKTLSRIKLKFS